MEFNLTILREANQGFFDIGVNFEDIFCSAKVDCKNDAGQPIKLLFNPATGQRDTTIVSAFACTAGAGAGTSTVLYRDALTVVCGGQTTTLDPAAGKGNAYTSSNPDPQVDAIWQYAVYADDEQLLCNGTPCNKRYWNVAFGLDKTADNCVLTTRMTASSASLSGFTTPVATTYPYIDVVVPLTDTNDLICNKHPLDVSSGSAVSTKYTPISLPETFDASFSGNTLEINAASTSGASGSPSLNLDPHYSSVTLHLNGEGGSVTDNNSFIDSSSSNHALTRVGNPTQGSLSPYSPTGWSGYFDGNGDCVRTPKTSALDFGTTDFTLEAWIRPQAMPTSDAWPSAYWALQAIAGLGSPSAADGLNLILGQTKLILQSNDAPLISATHNIRPGAWYHVAVSRASTSYRLFVNGAQIGTTLTSSATLGTGSHFNIGCETGETSWFHGHISDVRLIKGTSLYTSNFTPPQVPLSAISGTTLLTLRENRFVDRSSSAHALDSIGDAAATPASPFPPTGSYVASTHGGSATLTGDDYFSMPMATAPSGTEDFTIEYWINHSTVRNYAGGIWGRRIDVPDNLQIYWGYPTGGYHLLHNDVSLVGETRLNPANVWEHYAWVRSGNLFSLYVNGSLVASKTNNVDITKNYSHMLLGFANFASPLTGHISDFRITRGTAVYTANFTPPIAPLSNIPGTSVLLNFTNGGVVDFAYKSNFETLGTAGISNSQVKFGANSLSFGSVGDRITTAPGNRNYALGSGDFTLEAWVYPTAFSTTYQALFDFRNGSNLQASAPLVWIHTDGRVRWQDTLGASSALSLNAWSHVAVVRKSGWVGLFVNGEFNGAVLDNNAFTGTRMTIGALNDAPNSNYFRGFMDEVRITRGVARYTVDFTPSTAPLTALSGTSLLTLQDSTFVDNSGNGITLTLAGNTATQSTGPTPAFTWSAYFDGSGDFITASNSALALGTGDFTLEAWIRPSSIYNYLTVLTTRPNDAGYADGYHIGITGNGTLTLYSNNWIAPTAAGTITANVWNHIAYVRKSGVVTGFVNGSLVSTQANNQNFTRSVLTIGGMASGQEPFTGQISNVRIVKGSAIYGNGFAAPVSAFSTR